MSPLAGAISAALVQSLWQDAVVAALLWLALAALRRSSANARYAISCAALGLMVLVPIATAVTFDVSAVAPATSAPVVEGTARTVAPMPLTTVPATVAPPAALGLVGTATRVAQDIQHAPWTVTVQTWALPVWSLGVLLLSLRLLGGGAYSVALRRRGAPADEAIRALVARMGQRTGVDRSVQVLISTLADSPATLGWLRPVILLPPATVLGLTPQQLEAVLAHELAHIRRHDYLVNVLQMLVETVLFYHPAVWWASRQIRVERELCCDDVAVAACGDALCYAQALTKIFSLRSTAASLALGATDGPLVRRIERLVGGAATRRRRSPWPVALGLCLALASGALNVTWIRMHAQSERSTNTVAGETASGARETVPEDRFLPAMTFDTSPDTRPAFEAADVHVSDPSAFPSLSGGGLLGEDPYELKNVTMLDLITRAYGVDDDKVLGGPSWLESDRFDVIAEARAGAVKGSTETMLQALLADRFKLAVHTYMKPFPVYVLTVGSDGAKLTHASGSDQFGCGTRNAQAPGGAPELVASCHNLSMAAFADDVHLLAGNYLDHPVVDATKLDGAWDFDVTWTARPQLAAAGAEGISIFDAVEHQLGLKLEFEERPMQVVAIDAVNRTPTDNPPGARPNLSAAQPKFAAADITPSESASQAWGIRYLGDGHVAARGSLRDLIVSSLDISPRIRADLLVGGPTFLDTEHFDIAAKTPSIGAGAPSHDGGQEVAPPFRAAVMMLHALLVDRFKLATHIEDRQATVYALVASSGESKLKKADDEERIGCKPEPEPGTATLRYRCQNTTMAALAQDVELWANGYIDHPVVDTSGLQGSWDFVLSWTPWNVLHPAAPADGSSPVAVPFGALSVFDALEKELGLKLVEQRHMIPVVVIDHVESTPTAN